MSAADDQGGAGPVVEPDGTVHVAAFDLPMSAALSEASKAMLSRALAGQSNFAGFPDPAEFAREADFNAAIDAFRLNLDEGMIKPGSEMLRARYPVEIKAGRIGGVPVEEFTPQDGVDAERVLINLHGGAFFSGAIYVARLESIPVAHMGKFRVVSVDYRQGYEHRFPAASEDVAAVYAELLKDYAPSQIGIYGGSAGGMLASQATAWILKEGLPAPGAIGIFGAGTGGEGDGAYFSAIGRGRAPPDRAMSSLVRGRFGYFAGASEDDPMVNPNKAPLALRAKFPPALLITGTRAFDLSPAIATHRALCQAGVDAQLHVFDGLGHCFYYDATTPESLDAYDMIIRFFREKLGRTAPTP